MLFVNIALIFNMFFFSRSPRKFGKKRTYKYPAKAAKKVLPTIAEEDYNLDPQPQVTPPFPSHPIFGSAHPPVVGGYGPYTPIGSDVLYNSLPCNRSYSDSNSSSDLNNLHYTRYNISSSSSKGSARAASGEKPPSKFGPDRWTKHLKGQTSGEEVDVLGPITDEERSAAVLSDADTDKLLSSADDEESEVTLSEDSDRSQVQNRVNRAMPQSPQFSSSPSSISGISPVVPAPIGSHPPFPTACPRFRLPTLPDNYFNHSSPPLFRPSRPPFSSELPPPAPPLTRATAPRLPRPSPSARTNTPSELSRPALPFRATTPRPVQPPPVTHTRPFYTPRHQSSNSKQIYTMPPPTLPPYAISSSCILHP